jgi:hypothetical protein
MQDLWLSATMPAKHAKAPSYGCCGEQGGKAWLRGQHPLGTVEIADMSWVPRISSVKTAGHRFIRQQRSPRPRRMYPFLHHHRRLPVVLLHHRRSKPEGHNGRGHDDILSSLAV